MNHFKLFCLCLESHHLQNIKYLNYIPVGLGQNKFSKEWLTDDKGENISTKNPFYAEYSFHYWLWKNRLSELQDNEWLGFCGYRYHWSQQSKIKSDELNKIVNKDNFKDYILKKIPDEWSDYEVILGDEMAVNNYKLSKILKHAKLKFLMNPELLLKKNRNIKLHFDIFHGEGYLEKAIRLLDKKDQDGFEEFVVTKTSFNRENMFFCRSKKLLNEYYKCIFRWLDKCEDVFGFNLHGYSKKRIYAFLAERFVSYWFQKNSNYINWPIFFYDTNANKLILK